MTAKDPPNRIFSDIDSKWCGKKELHYALQKEGMDEETMAPDVESKLFYLYKCKNIPKYKVTNLILFYLKIF